MRPGPSGIEKLHQLRAQRLSASGEDDRAAPADTGFESPKRSLAMDEVSLRARGMQGFSWGAARLFGPESPSQLRIAALTV